MNHLIMEKKPQPDLIQNKTLNKTVSCTKLIVIIILNYIHSK